jgi:hypothetical protein
LANDMARAIYSSPTIFLELVIKSGTKLPSGLAIVSAHILEMLGSNAGRNIGYPDWHFVYQCLQANARLVPRVGHNRFLQNPFQFISQSTVRRYVA